MNKKIKVKPLAVKNLREAFIWYEQQQLGLGGEFIDEWESVVIHISKNGEAYSKKYKNFRQTLLKRFPYVVVYELEDDDIIIYNLINTKRHISKRYKKK